jgi:hypothetical protein
MEPKNNGFRWIQMPIALPEPCRVSVTVSPCHLPSVERKLSAQEHAAGLVTILLHGTK